MGRNVNLSILVVDDSVSMTAMIQSALKMAGYKQISVSNSARKALTIVKNKKIDLVLCDWNMPDMNGIDLMAEIRKNPKFINIRFIMVTGSNNANNVKTALAYGVLDFILKPFSADILISKIDSIDCTEESLKEDVFSTLNVLLVDDSPSARKLIVGLLNSIGVDHVKDTDNVTQAQAWIKEGNLADVVLCDWNMAEVCGLEFLKWLRSKGATKDIPFIMITSQSQERKIEEAIAGGVNEYLIKPFRPSELAKKLMRTIKNDS